jgi:hypothetical protein
MKTGDLEPPWIVDIADSAGLADFTTRESVRFEAWRETRNGPVLAFTDTSPDVALSPSNAAAAVSHTWVEGETDEPGPLHASVVVIWPGGREQSFPGTGTASLILET